MSEISDGDLEAIEELFAASVLRMLLEEGMISKELVENMNSWKHSGFSSSQLFIASLERSFFILFGSLLKRVQ